jgi:flagellar biosynthetic protein FliR
MLTFSEAQLMAWLSPLIWPFLRVLALFSVTPVLSSRAIPVRARVALSLLIALAAQPSLGVQPVVALDSPAALGLVVQQVGVGLMLGFAVRLVFAAMELAGELVGLQMGLNFAGFFDPSSNTQSSAVARFFNHNAVLLFVVLNGHMMVLMAVIRSFETFPIGGDFLGILGRIKLHQLGAEVFASALWIALPMIGLLLLVNLTMGFVSRVAPQINIFAVGFPVTLLVGLLGIAASLPMLEFPMTTLMDQAFALFLPR